MCRGNTLGLLFIVVIMLLTGCGRIRSTALYIDGELTKAVAEEETNFDNHNYLNTYIDDRPVVLMETCISFNDNLLYAREYGLAICIDISRELIDDMCEEIGCSHRINSHKQGCMAFGYRGRIICDSNGYYLQDAASLYYVGADRTKKRVFTNDYCTEMEKKLSPENPYAAYACFYHDGIMYVVGYSYMYKVDMNTWQKVSEPIELSDTSIQNAAVLHNYLFYTNEAMELYCYDMEKQQIKLISEHTYRVRIIGETIYYLKRGKLYQCDTDGNNTEMIIDGCYQSFDVSNDKIYFANADGKLSYYDIMQKEMHVIEVPAEYENNIQYGHIMTNSQCKYVYYLDVSNNCAKAGKDVCICVNKITQQVEKVIPLNCK